ncbi:MAG: hypothetical protein JWN03_2890 [Nocardia sp.]|uniref:hypothetical protein n=1 Tax=Nocardia sp. TaxID=1821 RepID=UPI002629B56D|nr:hypothetical protein [Nocardia sp.]MCU1642615.1 hypothetical protein [Nocardia sp.]
MDSGKDESADRPEATPGAEPAPRGAHEPPQDGAPQADSGSPFGSGPGAVGGSDFGPPLSEFGPSLNEFGPPISVFGPTTDTYSVQGNDFGAPLNEFGSAAPGFGAPPSDFGAEAGAPGWAPPAVPASPELAWRPAGGEYLAPDSSVPPSQDTTGDDALYGTEFGDPESVEETVRYNVEPAPPAKKPSAGWARGGGISTAAFAGRESAWLRSADAGMPPDAPESAAPQQESLSWADDPIGRMLMPKKTEPKSESLSWADDPIAQRLAPKSAAPQDKPKTSRKPILIGAGVVVVLAAVAAVVVALTGGGDKSDSAAASSNSDGLVTTAAPTTVAALSCPTKRDGPLTIGNGAGGTETGADAILGFQHAFYSDRNGVKARAFVAPDAANVSQADTIQQAINDVIPIGTSYCLRITDAGPDVYDADLTEHRPDGTTTVYRQHILTVNKDGKHLIFAIDER